MGDTNIEWTDATWNPIRGTLGRHTCVKVSPGCQYCYAERMNVRFGGPEYKVGADTPRLDERALGEPMRWKTPRKVFVCSMTDLFGEWVPDEWIAQIFNVMAQLPQHTYQVLTKRPSRMRKLLTNLAENSKVLRVPFWPLPNVWVGATFENQEQANLRMLHLLETPAAVHFGSFEPLLGAIDPTRLTIIAPEPPHEDLGVWLNALTGYVAGPDEYLDGRAHLDWVIVGGESGGPSERRLVTTCRCRYVPHEEPGLEGDWDCGGSARTTIQVNHRTQTWTTLESTPRRADCDDCRACRGWAPIPERAKWVRAIRDQCVAANVPFLFKQWGGPHHDAAGRQLDGRTWDQYPETKGA